MPLQSIVPSTLQFCILLFHSTLSCNLEQSRGNDEWTSSSPSCYEVLYNIAATFFIIHLPITMMRTCANTARQKHRMLECPQIKIRRLLECQGIPLITAFPNHKVGNIRVITLMWVCSADCIWIQHNHVVIVGKVYF